MNRWTGEWYLAVMDLSQAQNQNLSKRQPFYEMWNIPNKDSFLFKAQQNFRAADMAKDKGMFDVESSRRYYALHQLACELVMRGMMKVSNPGPHATKGQPYRIAHGSYNDEVADLLQMSDAQRTYTNWQGCRHRADYNPNRVGETTQWKRGVDEYRKGAENVAVAIYEKFQS